MTVTNFNRRYRYALLAAIVGWVLAAPIIIAYESTVPDMYQRYMNKAMANNGGQYLDMAEWAAAGQPPYVARLYEWDGPAWLLGITSSVPLTWYFCLMRLRELSSAIRRETKDDGE
jgi:hypothetical protein